ncbi:MAG: PadR family transcriptional regulator [Planctomycetes bacterium]|nr:PadR family transcriptional regulator [Planctomycetota bacterium]
MSTDPDLVRGTLSTMLLEVISRRPMYGYEICKTVNARTDGYFNLREGSLYPALHKLEQEGLLKAFWEQTSGGRRRKYYEITDAGVKTLADKRREWSDFAAAVERVLATMVPTPAPAPAVNPIG